MNAALYMRMSTDKQENSIDSQQEILESYAKTHKMKIINRYIDKGISGRTAEKRPSFMQMIDDSSRELFDAVLIYDSSRFARNLEESIVYKSELKRNGVKLISVTEPTIDDDSSLITDAMLGALNEMYSRKLSRSVKRGMVYQVQKGFYQTPPPFGYTKKDNITNIVPEEANIIRMIYEMFIENPSWYSVAVRLNNLNIPRRKSASWSSRDIKRTLTNPIYIGKIAYNGTEYKGNHQPIISIELWEKVQKLIESKPKTKHRPPLSYKHWLSGLLKCGKCGSAMNHSTRYCKDKTYYFYRCSGNANARCKYTNSMSINKLEMLVRTSLENLIANEDSNNYKNFVIIRKDEDKLEILQESLRKLKTKMNRFKDAYAAGVDTLEEYKENKNKCQKAETEIQEQINMLTDNEFSEEKFKMLKDSSNRLIDLLFSDDYTIEQKSNAIKGLIEKIILDKYTGDFLIYYHL